jgi:hypothetical protein
MYVYTYMYYTGYVTSKQFSKAMKSCDVELSDTDVSRITMRFDHDEIQRINTDMFIKLIRGQPYQSKGNIYIYIYTYIHIYTYIYTYIYIYIYIYKVR